MATVTQIYQLVNDAAKEALGSKANIAEKPSGTNFVGITLTVISASSLALPLLSYLSPISMTRILS